MKKELHQCQKKQREKGRRRGSPKGEKNNCENRESEIEGEGMGPGIHTDRLPKQVAVWEKGKTDGLGIDAGLTVNKKLISIPIKKSPQMSESQKSTIQSQREIVPDLFNLQSNKLNQLQPFPVAVLSLSRKAAAFYY